MFEEDSCRLELNKLVHEPSRLHILTLLASDAEKERNFTELQERLQLTSGNLSVQLKNLQSAGLITITKRFEDSKPQTTVEITDEGVNALMDYLDEMERLILSVKKERKQER